MSKLELFIEKWFSHEPSLTFRKKLANFFGLFIFENLWVYGVFALISFLWPMYGMAPVDPMQEMMEQIFGPTLRFNLFMAVIIAPVTEEILFRWLPVRFADQAPRRLFVPIIVLSQFIFGYIHGAGGLSLMIQGLGGFLMCWLYIRNGRNLWWTISYHMLWNLIYTLGE